MTDIRSLIEEADKVFAVPASLMGGTSFIIPIGLFKRMRDALSLTVSPLPEEIAGLIENLRAAAENRWPIGGIPSDALFQKAAAALQRLARENERLQKQQAADDEIDGIRQDELDRSEARIRELEAERDKLKQELAVAVKFHERDAADYEALMDERDAIKTKVSNLLDLLDQGGLPEEYQVARLQVASHVGYEPASDLQKRHDTEFVDAIRAKTIEDCAKVADREGQASDGGEYWIAARIAKFIRALNQQKPPAETE